MTTHQQLMRHRILGLTLAGLLSGCSWLHTTEDNAAANVSAQAVSDVSIVCSTDLDNRNPADPFGYSLPAYASAQSDMIIIGGRDARAHVYDMSCHEVSRTPLNNTSDSGALVLNNGLAIVGDTAGVLYGIYPDSGEIAWQFPLSGPLTGQPVAIGEDVLVQTLDNRLYRIDAKGQKVWSFTAATTGLGIYLTPSPLVQGDKVFVLFNNGDAFALAVDNGDVLWRKQLLLSNDAAVLDEIKAPMASPVALKQITWGNDSGKDVVLFSFYQGNIMALDAGEGRLLFSKKLSIRSAPIVEDERMIVADATGLLQAINTQNGRVIWSLQLGQNELIGPTRYQDAYWVADVDGQVYRVSMDGRLEASIELQGEITRPLIPASRYGVLAHTNLGALYLLH